jgi:hypothetical protein
MNRKILLAPVLAIALAFLLAGAVSFLPQNASQSQPTPQLTSIPGSIMTPLPTSIPMAQTASPLNGLAPILFAVAAVLVGAVAACLLFSEKNLKKEISQ